MNQEVPRLRKRLRFKRPPIVEAVLAFNVNMLPEEVLGSFERLSDQMRAHGYGQSEPMWQHNLAIKFELGISSSGEDNVLRLGVKFKSDDGLHAVQFNRTGVVFSRLGNYTSWDQFRNEAKKLWALYSEAASDPIVQSIGVRYINKLFLPTNEKVEEYVTVWPHLPSGIAQRIDDLQMRLVLPLSDPEGRLVHTQMLLPPEKEGFAALLFDNDFQFATSVMTSQEIWQMLETVRDVKDDYFEHFTTDKMRKTFDA